MPKSTTGLRNAVRIIGGEHRSRRIQFPDAPGLRPTADRVRETLFNWLQEDVGGARCLDLFAGSGALGLEALSRGASVVTFVDTNSDAIAAISTALATLAISGSIAQRADAQSWITTHDGKTAPYDIIFLDPPFADKLLPTICHALANSALLAAGCRIYIEDESPVTADALPASWQMSKSKRAGAVHFYLFDNA